MLQKLFAYFVICWCCLFGWANSATAQTESELEDAVESLEELAEELGGNIESGAEEIGEALEDLLEEHSEELEQWVDRYSGQWEDWAESFEERFNVWAKDQERLWERWAESYNQKWESWADELDEEEMDPERIGEIVQRNLKMFGDMPLGKLVEDLLTEGTESFQSVPWESIDDLQGVLKDSIAKSVEETERRLAEAKRKRLIESHERKADSKKAVDFILPLTDDGNQNDDQSRNQQQALAKQIDNKINSLKRRLSSGDLDEDKVKSLVHQLMALSKAKKAAAMKSADRRKTEALEAARKRASEARKRAMQDRDADRKKAEKQLLESRERMRKAQGESAGNRELIEKMYRAFGAEQRKLDEKESELEAMRKELKLLREEVRRMQRKQKIDRT